jgi:hypothetical protein
LKLVWWLFSVILRTLCTGFSRKWRKSNIL